MDWPKLDWPKQYGQKSWPKAVSSRRVEPQLKVSLFVPSPANVILLRSFPGILVVFSKAGTLRHNNHNPQKFWSEWYECLRVETTARLNNTSNLHFAPFLSPLLRILLNPFLLFTSLLPTSIFSCSEHFFESNPILHFGSIRPAEPKIEPKNQTPKPPNPPPQNHIQNQNL